MNIPLCSAPHPARRPSWPALSLHASRLTPQPSRLTPHTPQAALRTGFTLIEILVAIGIFSMVLAAIYSSWTSILRASKIGLAAAAAVQRARVTGRTIEESLSSAVSFTVHQQMHPAYYAFMAQNGDDASLSFVSHLSPSFPRHGKFGDLNVRRVTFSVEPSQDGGRQLVLRQNPILMDMDKDEKNYPLVLAKNVKEFKTEFWDPRLQEWDDQWLLTNQLPILVKVTLKLADNAFTTQVGEQMTRIVSLPAVGVQTFWQTPRVLPGTAGFPGGFGFPGGPGGVPPGPNPALPGAPH